MSDPAYRQDIDGLRALAVSVIVLFHMGVAQLSGGYIGVDIFFVISGYLITGHLLRDLNAGTFRFGQFYMRRLRRLAPSLLVVLSATLVAGYVLFSLEQYERLGKSVLAGLFSVSNIFFWLEAGYFDEAAISKPLLHLWSLGVEEQFYLIWPVVLLALARLGQLNRVGWVLAGLGLVSLAASEALLSRAPTTVFFLMPFRLAEFALGAVLAAHPGLSPRPGARAHTVAGLGLALVVAGLILLDEHSRFPGLASLLPGVGTAALIAAGPGAWVNRVFALAPLRYIGRASYSIYLVHWPILVFYVQRKAPPDSAGEIALLCLAAFLAGAFLYHAVETPFRRRGPDGFRLSGRVVRRAALAHALVLLVACGFVIDRNGLPWRVPQDMRALHEARGHERDARVAAIRQDSCHHSAKTVEIYFDRFGTCLPAERRDMIVVYGDSHAADLYAAVAARFADRNVVQLTGAGCGARNRDKPHLACDGFHQMAQDWLAQNADQISLILYTQRGGHLLNGDPDEGDQDLAVDPAAIQRLRAFLDDTARIGPPVVFIGTRPEYHPKISVILSRSINMDSFNTNMQALDTAPYQQVDAALSSALAGGDVRYISVFDTVCADAPCPYLMPDNTPIIVDYGHWGASGAVYMLNRLIEADPALRAALALSP